MKRSFLLVPLCSLFSTGVLAQVEAPPPPAAAEGAAVEAAPPSAASQGMRVRFGASGGVGAFLNPGALMFGAEGRVGLQLDPMLGAYVAFQEAGGIGIGASASSTGGSASVTGVGYWRLAVIGEATFMDRLFVGAGPALLNGGWATASASAGTGGGAAGVTTVSGFVPAANVRLGIGFGRPNESGRRTGFNMALDTTFAFSSGGVSIAPLLLFGFESK